MDSSDSDVTLMETLLETSSSSSNSDQDVNYVMDILGHNKRHSVENFVANVVDNYTDEEFRRHFRVSRRTASIICQKFANSKYFTHRTKSGGRIPVSAETHTLAFLWYAGNKSSYREVSNLFDLSISSGYRSQTAFLSFLYEISPTYIKMPSTDAEKAEKSKEFKKLAGFDNVLGCIDGSYIYIRNPAHKIRSTYVNRHGLISITLQGICDAKKRFLDVFVGPSSKIHDSRIYDLSHISKDIPTICGSKYHLLGDAAYPLREFLLTPYRDYGDLTEKQKKYNKKHCQTRVKIENAFGLLKQRFRQLTRLDYHTVLRMSQFVLACCVLHNLCITEGDLWEDEVPSNPHSGERAYTESEASSVEASILLIQGQKKRHNVCETL